MLSPQNFSKLVLKLPLCLQVISENFRFLAPSMDRLQQVFDDDRVKVDGNLVGSEHRLSSNEMVELLVHMHEPEVCL